MAFQCLSCWKKEQVRNGGHPGPWAEVPRPWWYGIGFWHRGPCEDCGVTDICHDTKEGAGGEPPCPEPMPPKPGYTCPLNDDEPCPVGIYPPVAEVCAVCPLKVWWEPEAMFMPWPPELLEVV